jgi:serine-type D-Ala-D-Ala carboxypeptidase/endopeptidase (penicillin-binding protein 4)
MNVRRLGVLLLAGGLVISPAGACAQELNQRLESVIAGAKIHQAVVGVSIQDLETGRVLADIRGEMPLIPASNQKLLTTGSALRVLGPDFAFRTELILSGEHGERLVIRGSGDPALADPSILGRMTPKMTVEGLLEALARAVAQSGARRVTEVIADDRIFDRALVHQTWPRDQLERWYCAPVSGLNFHTNVISVFPSPAQRVGASPVIETEPLAPWIEIENRARTVGEGKNSVWLSRDTSAQRYTMYGDVRFASQSPIEVTLFDPARFFAQLVAAELPRAGVAVGQVGATEDGRRLTGAALEAAVGAARLAAEDEKLDGRVVAVVTTNIRDILERCNNDSQNLYAEALLKRVGAEVTREAGTWSNGAAVVRMMLSDDADLGPRYAASTVVADGSGMSRENRVSPRTLTKWLAHLHKDEKLGPLFKESLASPGGGTLRNRFRAAKLENELHAKSGKISGVRCLSGYMTDPRTGRVVAFSVMVNEMREGDPLPVLQLHEDVVLAIDRWLVARRPVREAGAPASHSVKRKR